MFDGKSLTRFHEGRFEGSMFDSCPGRLVTIMRRLVQPPPYSSIQPLRCSPLPGNPHTLPCGLFALLL